MEAGLQSGCLALQEQQQHMIQKILLRDRWYRRPVRGQGLAVGRELGRAPGVGAWESSPEEVEGGLGGGQDVERYRQCQALSEVGQVELGASKLPLHVGVVLEARDRGLRKDSSGTSPPCPLTQPLFCHSLCLPSSVPAAFFSPF